MPVLTSNPSLSTVLPRVFLIKKNQYLMLQSLFVLRLSEAYSTHLTGQIVEQEPGDNLHF